MKTTWTKEWIADEQVGRIRLRGGDKNDWIDLEPPLEEGKVTEIQKIQHIVGRDGVVTGVYVQTNKSSFHISHPFNPEKMFISKID